MSPRYSAQDKLIKLARMIIETTEFLVVSQYTEKNSPKNVLRRLLKVRWRAWRLWLTSRVFLAFSCGLNRSAFQEECLLHGGGAPTSCGDGDALIIIAICSEGKRGREVGFYTMSGVKGRTSLVY